MACRSSAGSVWLTRFFSVRSLLSSVFFACGDIGPARDRVANGALQVDGFRSEGRPIDRIDASGPERILRARDDQPLERELRRLPCRLGQRSVWRRVAASASDCTTSIGAMVPISTRAWLSAISFSASSSELCATRTASCAYTRSQWRSGRLRACY